MSAASPGQLFVEHMLHYTVRLIRDAAMIGATSGVASGIIVERPRRFIVLTAGHIFETPGTWTLETQVVVGTSTLHITLTDVQRLCSIDLPSGETSYIDLAWSPINTAMLKEQMREDPLIQDRAISLPVYKGPLHHLPLSGESYGFAAWSRVELHHSRCALFSEASFEIGMEYRGQRPEDGLYEFGLARPHQGNEYYWGASGAPIANEEGKIVSILLAGDPRLNVLWGAPLARYVPLLDIDDSA